MPPLSHSMASLGHGPRTPSASGAPEVLLPRAAPGKLLQHPPKTDQMLVSVGAALRQVQSGVGAGVGDAPVDNPRELNAVHVGRHNAVADSRGGKADDGRRPTNLATSS